MPGKANIKIGKKTFAHFKDAEAYVARTTGAEDPAAYTAAIARQEGALHPRKKKRGK